MDGLLVEITKQLHLLRARLSCDFTAYAVYNESNQVILWKCVSGNLNHRYKQMKGKSGKGLAGLAIRADRTIVFDRNSPNYQQQRLEYPILLAENLLTAIATPVKDKSKTCGVLLVGSRSMQHYVPDEIETVHDFKFTIENLCNDLARSRS